jgi:hypothetical protein
VARRRTARVLLVVLGFAVSALFTWLAVRNVELDEARQALEESNYLWLLPSLAALALAVFLRAFRWRLLFPPGSRPATRHVLGATLVGYLFNNILPLRAGEAARILVLHQRAGTSRFATLATALTERMYDLLSLLVVLFAATPFLPEVTWLRRAAILAAVLVVLAGAAVAVLAVWGDRPFRFLLRPLARLPHVSPERAERAALNLVHGMGGFRDARLALPAAAVTVTSWLALALSSWALVEGFDLPGGFGAALLVVIATNLAMVLPSSPSAIGVFEAATIVALGAFGVSESEALSYAVVLHVVNFLPYLAAGYVALHLHARALRARDVEAALTAERARTPASTS